MEIVPADERLETEDILELTNAGVYRITVADDFMVGLWSQRPEETSTPHPEVAVRTGTAASGGPFARTAPSSRAS